jgi:hypothetical protein
VISYESVTVESLPPRTFSKLSTFKVEMLTTGCTHLGLAAINLRKEML